jgi:hypothetical protein
VQLQRSLCTSVAGEAWRTARTGLRQATCWQSCVTRCTGSTGSVVGVSSLPGTLSGALWEGLTGYLMVINQNLIQEEIKRKLNSGNACYHSAQNLCLLACC